MRKFGRGNRAANGHCFLCGTKRPAAAAPTPKELADAKAEAAGETSKGKSESKSKKEQKPPKAPDAPPSKRRLRRDAKAMRKAEADAAEGWGGFVDSDKEEEEEEAAVETPKAAPPRLLQGAPAAKAAGAPLGKLPPAPLMSAAEKERLKALGLQVEAPTVSFKTRYPIPTKLTLGTPKEAVAAAMAGNASVKAAALKEAVAKQTKAVESAVDSFGNKHQIAVLAKAELAKTKEELVAVSEHAPPSVSKAAAQKIARALRKAQDNHTERLLKDQAGMEKAEAKFAADNQALRDAIEELEGRIDNLCSARSASQEAWQLRMLAIAAHETDVAREFKDQIALATPGGLELDFADGEDASAETVDEDLAKLSDLDLCAADLALEDIPAILLEKAEEADVVVLNSIGAFYLSVPLGVALPAVTYTLLGVADPLFAKGLVGDKIWDAIYKTKVPVAEDWVPRQLVEILRCTLNSLASQLVKREDHPQAVVAAKARLAQAKANARSSPYTM